MADKHCETCICERRAPVQADRGHRQGETPIGYGSLYGPNIWKHTLSIQANTVRAKQPNASLKEADLLTTSWLTYRTQNRQLGSPLTVTVCGGLKGRKQGWMNVVVVVNLPHRCRRLF